MFFAWLFFENRWFFDAFEKLGNGGGVWNNCEMDLCPSFFCCCVNVTWRRWDELETLMDDFATMDMTGRKCQMKRWLIIMTSRGAAFYFLLLFYFLIMFVVCKLWGLICVLHEVLKSRISDGALFLWFFFMDWWKWCWRMDGVGNTLVFRLLSFYFSIMIVVENSREKCLKIQVVMVLLIRLHEFHYIEVGEQNIKVWMRQEGLQDGNDEKL